MFEKVMNILDSESSNVVDLARIVAHNDYVDFYRGVDFSGVSLINADLSEFDLTGANFSGAIMDGTTLLGLNVSLNCGLLSSQDYVEFTKDLIDVNNCAEQMQKEILDLRRDEVLHDRVGKSTIYQEGNEILFKLSDEMIQILVDIMYTIFSKNSTMTIRDIRDVEGMLRRLADTNRDFGILFSQNPTPQPFFVVNGDEDNEALGKITKFARINHVINFLEESSARAIHETNRVANQFVKALHGRAGS